MFLAIINDTYSEVKAELAAKETEKLVEEYFKKGYTNVLGKISGSSSDKKPQKIMNALQSAYLDDENVTFAELRQNLKKANFSDVEIEMFMSQYDTNENEEIDEEEAINVFRDLAKGKKITGLQENLPKIKMSELPPPNEADIEKYQHFLSTIFSHVLLFITQLFIF